MQHPSLEVREGSSQELVQPGVCPPICLGAPTYTVNGGAGISREPPRTSADNPLFLKRKAEAQRVQGLAQCFPVSWEYSQVWTQNS